MLSGDSEWKDIDDWLKQCLSVSGSLEYERTEDTLKYLTDLRHSLESNDNIVKEDIFAALLDIEKQFRVHGTLNVCQFYLCSNLLRRFVV